MLSPFKTLIERLRSNLRRLRAEHGERVRRRESERLRALEDQRREEERRRSMYRKGNDFEDHVRSMFPEDRFELIHRTPTHDGAGGRYTPSMVYPDLRFRDRVTGRRFWVEVKFRSRTEQDGSMVWCTDAQLRNYKRTMHETGEKVFVMIGVGGTTDDPGRLYCLDLERLNFTRLFYGTYRGHRLMFGTVCSLEQLEYISSHDCV